MKEKSLRDREPTRHGFFQNFIILQIFLAIVALAHAWTLQYKSADGAFNYLQRASFTGEDKPWTPPGTESTAILHLHHFGDWTLGLAYSLYSNPYDPGLDIPGITPPLGLLILSFFAILGTKISYLVFLVLTLWLWLRLIAMIFPKETLLEKVTILSFFVLLTMPTLNAVDRGAVHLFLFGLIGNSFQALSVGRKKQAAIMFIVAVSFRPYLIFLSVYLLRNLRIKSVEKITDLFKLWVSIAILNLTALGFYSRNLLEGIKDYVSATLAYSSEPIVPWVMDSHSIMGFISKTIEALDSSESAARFLSENLQWSFVPAIMLILLVGVVATNSYTPEILSIPLILSLSSLIAPPSMQYTLTWGSLAAVLMLSKISESHFQLNWNKFELLHKVAFFLIIIAVALVLAPYFGKLITPSGLNRSHPAGYLYVPLILSSIVLVVIAFFRSCLFKTSINR
jgi:hypothetical protein